MISIFLILIMLLSTLSIHVNTVLADEGDEFDTLRNRWVTLTTGGDAFDVDNEDYKLKLETLSKNGKDAWDNMNKDIDRVRLWEEYAVEEKTHAGSNAIQFTYQRLEIMANAYATRGTELYHNADLKKEIVSALDFMYEKYYNENLEYNNGTPYGNWFGWTIGNPMSLMATVMLMYDDLSQQQIINYAAASMKYAKAGPVHDNDNSANGIWRRKCDLYVGIATKNKDLIDKVKNIYPIFIKYVTGGEGYYSDGTFIAHSSHLYNGGYGAGMFRDQVELLYYLADSPWDMGDLDIHNIYKFAYDSYIPFFSNGLFMDLTLGREITRQGSEYKVGRELMVTLLKLASIAGEEDKAKISSYLKAWLSHEEVNEYFNANSGIFDIKLKNALVADDAITSRKGEQIYKQYTVGDTAVFHSPYGFSAGVGMHSKRIYNYETGDSNVKGWHTRNGRLALYTDDLNQNDDSVKATIDWQRIPGTTVANDTKANANFGGEGSYAGGVSMEGLYGTSATRLVPNNNALQANKSYFMFDDEIVAMGSGIKGIVADKNIETILDNYRLEREGQAISINGEAKDTAMGTTSYNAVNWLWRQGNTEGSNLGIYFPKATTIEATRDTRSGKLEDLGSFNVGLDHMYTEKYLTLYQNHGKQPESADYAYVLLPNQSQDATKAYVDNPDIEIIKQDTNVHAVYEKNLNVVGMNTFTDAKTSIDAFGVKNYLSVDAISSTMIKESSHTLSLSIADITQTNQGKINVIVNREATSIISKDEAIEVVSMGPYIQLKVDVNKTKGREINITFSFADVTEAPTKPVITKHEFKDNAIHITFNNAKRATSYVLRYGEQPGQYTNSMDLGLSNSATITGLKDEVSYYFAVEAKNSIGGIFSDEIVQKFGDTNPMGTYVEDFDDFSKIYTKSGSWGLEKITSGNQGRNDTSLFKRNNQNGDSLTYAIAGMNGFELLAYKCGFSGHDVTKIIFEVSEDMVTWKPVEADSTNHTSTAQFYEEKYTADNLPTGSRFLRITINGGVSSQLWAPQLSYLKIHYNKSEMIDEVTSVAFTNETFEIGKGDVISLDYAINPANARNYELFFSSEDKSIISVEGDTIIGLEYGETKVSVKDKNGVLLGETKVIVANPNAALGAKATAQTSDSKQPPALAVDGNETTRWATGKIDSKQDQWFQVDLGMPTEISKIVIMWEASHAKDFKLQVSNSENGPWITIETLTNASGGTQTYTYNQEETVGRYVRMHATKSSSVIWGYSIYEFKVFGKQEQIALEKIEIVPANLDLLKNEETNLSVIFTPNNVKNKMLAWSTDNPGVVTVDVNGKVKAIGGGSAIIKAKIGDKEATCNVVVTDSSTPPVRITDITLNTGNKDIFVGEDFLVEVTITPENATNKNILYTSSNTSVATISKTGKIIALMAGTTTITVENKANDIQKSFILTVKEVPVVVPGTSIQLNTGDRDLVVGEGFQVVASVLPEEAMNRILAYTSSSPEVATISEAGMIQALTVGTTTITVSNEANDIEETFIITVKTVIIHVESIALNASEHSMNVGDTFALEANTTPNNVTDKQMIYSSSSPAIATVDQNGNIVAKQVGTAEITVKDKITSIEAKCTITVQAIIEETLEEKIKLAITDLKDKENLTNEEVLRVIGIKEEIDLAESVTLTMQEIIAMDTILVRACHKMNIIIDNQSLLKGITARGILLGTRLSDYSNINDQTLKLVIKDTKEDSILKNIKDFITEKGWIFGQGLDIQLLLNNENIHTLSLPAIITINKPTDMPAGSTMKLIREHDGEIEVLEVIDNGETISFTTDAFSTYVIAYTKISIEPTPTPKPTPGTSPTTPGASVGTGDMTSLLLPTLGLFVSILGCKKVLKRKEEM